MRYALLIYEKPGAYARFSDDERSAVSGEYALGPRRARGRRRAAAARRDGDDRSRRTTGEPLITDGPFADTKEVFGGYYVFEADDLDEALEIAARIPALRIGGSVEVRPVMEPGDRLRSSRSSASEWGRVLAVLVGFLGDFELAEEAAQEAFAIAAERWPRDGTPANPAPGW